MMYAEAAAGRAEAAKGLQGTCPSCSAPVRPKCGSIVVWHWAHHARAQCDPWAEPDSEWHRGWQLAVPADRREVVMGPHRADVVTASGGVVELQHSGISPEVIAEREAFYGERMAWIFDATKADLTVTAAPPVLANTPCGCVNEQCAAIWLRPETVCRCGHAGCSGRMAAKQWQPAPQVRYRWKHARRSVSACRRPGLLDLGDGRMLRITRAGWEPEGVLYTRESVEGWLRGGTAWQRCPPGPPPYAPYDPPWREREQDPDGWRARQEKLRRWVLADDRRSGRPPC